MELTEQQKAVLLAVGDTLIPSLDKVGDEANYWKNKASDFPIVEEITKIISRLPQEDKKEFIGLLDTLNSPLLGLTWLNVPKGFLSLSPKKRKKLLNTWSKHPLPPLRKAFSTLKKLVGLVYFGYTSDEMPKNPNWEAVGYPDIPKNFNITTEDGSLLKMEEAVKGETLKCDVLIVGSGAGGGVVAAEMVKKGYEVIILEKGDYIHEGKMSQREMDMLSKMYDRGGAFSSIDGAVSILAGSCIGGGTTVNWSASFRTPDYILAEWAKEHDNPQFLDPDYEKCFDFIEKKTRINTDLSVHNPQNQKLWEGAKKLGYHTGLIPRNVAPPKGNTYSDDYWKSQGYGGLGDKYGYKQGVMKTFLKEAVEGGAKIYANTRVEKITHSKGEVTGAIAYQDDKGNGKNLLTIHCKKVMVCAGALHTPVILQKSGLSHPQIGKNLYLHPVNAVVGEYDEYIDGWHGPMMSAVSDEFIKLNGNFGYKLETPPLHSGFAALSSTWVSGEQFKQDMLKLRHLGTFIVLTRDKYGGQIKMSQEGRPRVQYKLNPFDKNHLIHGMKESAKIHAAAGAKKIRLLHNRHYVCDLEKDNPDKFMDKIGKINWGRNHFTLYSAHQMGTCRMGGRDKDHPLKPTGEAREIKNLFVADASAFPRCSGVNPMLSIQALAYYISKHI